MCAQSVEGQVLLMVAPTGAWLTKEELPRLPVTPEEVAAEALACRKAGAAALHLHVRDEQGKHTLDFMRYGEMLNAVRAAVADDMAIQITTEAAGRYTPREQMWTARSLTPDSVSLALRELLPEDADEELRGEVREFFDDLRGMEAGPQLICYTPQDVQRVVELHQEGFIPWPRPFVLFVLGSRTGEPATPEMLDAYLEAFAPLQGQGSWMACAFGPNQLDVLMEAARRGGHVRVGFENGSDIAPGQPAASNAELVAALAGRLRSEAGRELMDVATARDFFRDITRG